jgi:hypothetical protein
LCTCKQLIICIRLSMPSGKECYKWKTRYHLWHQRRRSVVCQQSWLRNLRCNLEINCLPYKLYFLIMYICLSILSSGVEAMAENIHLQLERYDVSRTLGVCKTIESNEYFGLHHTIQCCMLCSSVMHDMSNEKVTLKNSDTYMYADMSMMDK